MIRFRRPDRPVVAICVVAGLLMVALTVGAADARLGSRVVALFVAWGLGPYALTVALSCLDEPRRFISLTTRALAVVYAVFDNVLRYAALYHPTGSTDSIVVAVLPLWWCVLSLVIGGVVAVALSGLRVYHARHNPN
jgi:hypothetical protein